MTTVVSSNRLTEIAERVRAEHQAVGFAIGNMLESARRAGELLLEAKGQIQHGAWQPWLEASFDGSLRTAQAYMRVAKRWDEIAKTQDPAFLSLDGALRLLSEPREKERAPTQAEPEAKAEFWKREDARINPIPAANGKPPTAADVKRARKRAEPDPDVPAEFADYDPAADAPDPVEEWARAQAEVDRLTVVVEALQGEGDLQAEVVRLSKLYGQLDGRLRFEVTRANEAEKQATYQGKLLRQVREILSVERNREIMPCLRDLLK
jgi:hypothetical protein